MTFATRLFALVTALCLLCSSAGAMELGDTLDRYLDMNQDVQYAMSAQLETLSPYGEEALAMINAALSCISVGAVIADDQTTVDLCVDGESVMSLTEKTTDSGTELTTALLPNRTLISSGSVLDHLGGTEAETEKFELFTAIEELESCYQTLTDAIIPYAEEKTANYKITDIGTSKWSRIARLTPEQGAEVAPLIEQVLGCGMDEAYRQTLEGLKVHNGFIVGLYQLSEGKGDLALYMKGYLTFADGKARNLAYQWAFAEKDGLRTDTLKYELVQSKTAVDTRKIHVTLKRQATEKLLIKGSCEAAIKDADGNITTIHTYDLSGTEKGDVRPVTGSVSTVVKTREGDTTTTETLNVIPDVKLTSVDGSGVLSGTIRLETLKGKNLQTAFTLLMDDEPAALLQNGSFFVVHDAPVAMPESSLTQNSLTDSREKYLVGEPPIGLNDYESPESMQIIDLDSADNLDALWGEWTQNLAGKLLIAMAGLPEDGSALIRDNVSEEDFNAFLAMVDSL